MRTAPQLGAIALGVTVEFHPVDESQRIRETEADEAMEAASDIRNIAFLGNYLPRKRGLATLTSDVLSAVAAEHPESQCFAVPVATFATLSLDAVLAAME